LSNVPLAKTHELRAKINDGKNPEPEILKTYEPAVLAAVLKLYLLELPGINLAMERLMVRSIDVIHDLRYYQEHLFIE
jgi:hypothetical protein